MSRIDRPFVLVVSDGAADLPVAALGNRTPLQAAKTSGLDLLAGGGQMGTALHVPSELHPGSEVANLSVLGYDPVNVFTGRGPLEAAGRGISLKKDDVAFRLNLVTVADGKMHDYSAGHITTSEAGVLVEDLRAALEIPEMELVKGVSYRHLLLWHGGPKPAVTVSPHDIMGKPVSDNMPSGSGAGFLRDFFMRASEILKNHPVNLKRAEQGKPPANAVWPWGGGTRPSMPTLKELWGLGGYVITAVDLIRGIGALAGLEYIEVPGATGYLDTDFEGKARAAAQALTGNNLVFVHIEAPDEAGHGGDPHVKVRAIEALDAKFLMPLIELTSSLNPVIAVTSDHPTSVDARTHTRGHVPWVICSSDRIGVKGEFSEGSASSGPFYEHGHEWFRYLIKEFSS